MSGSRPGLEIAICVPVYNQSVRELVTEAQSQLKKLDGYGAIYLLDDGSEEKYRAENRRLGELELVQYKELKQNAGRSAIRNKLARWAAAEFLVFLDNDAVIHRSDWLEQYWKNRETHKVLCGGNEFKLQLKRGSELVYHYRKQREDYRFAKQGERHFTSGNFCLAKSVFNSVQFREEIVGYGHEDTAFGLDLQRAGFQLVQMENPLCYLQMDSSAQFLMKSRSALENLWALYRQEPETFGELPMLRLHGKLRSWGADQLGIKIFELIQKPLEKHLLGPRPSLQIFDLYRLLYLCKISRAAPKRT